MLRRNLAAIAAMSMVFSVLVLGPAGAAPLDETDLEAATAVISSENPFKGLPAGFFIVSLDDPSIALYEGGISGLRPTSTRGEAQLDVAAPAAVAYRTHLENQQARLIDRLNRDLARTVDVAGRYYNAANALAVHLSAQEAARVLRMPGVRSVVPDVIRQIDTDAGPGWIGAPSIWDGSATSINSRGEGIVVGVLDTGINPENPSFADVGGDGYDHTNPRGAGNYAGVCNPGEPAYQPGFPCNDKVIGAWNFTADPGPLDDDGHGSHTASTAAGNVVDATVVAPTLTITATISGVAPHANIIAYDVCSSGGCPGFAILGGIDQAIADGVDVINYSIGSPTPGDPWTEPDELGFLAAREAGIFVAHSAGNEGPDAATSGSPNAPWMIHVAATSHPRRFTNRIGSFTGGASALGAIEGLGFTGGYGPADIVYAGDFASAETATPELCGVGALGDFDSPWDPDTFDGEIVVCDRGTFGRVEKGANVLAAGAGGLVLVDNGAGLVGDAHDLPAVHITEADGLALEAWLSTGTGHKAEIRGAVESVDDANADVLAGFSSRGPNPGIDMVIPSISAPGVDIIAADGVGGETSWGFLSGTSMASPHVAGSAALLMSVHPDWSPAAIQSAMQLTAANVVVEEDGATPGTPFDRGSGRIDLPAAAQSGLVMDETVANYLAADPAAGGQVGAINLPSMANSACVLVCSWTRTVTATAAASWSASGMGADGLVVTVSPETFALSTGESQEITVTADVSRVTSRDHVFGYLMLEPDQDNGIGSIPVASMPLAVKAATGDIPESVHMATRRNSGSWQISDLTALAITDLTVEVDGLVKGDQHRAAVRQDSDNADVFDDVTDGTHLELIDVPAGATNIIAEILASESPDLDLFLGHDLNNDGVPSVDELECVSASGNALESCDFPEPPAGQWWVLVQNWAASAPNAKDALTLSTAVLTGNDEANMTIDGPDSVGPLEPFNVRVFFDEAMKPGDRLYGLFTLGTDSANPGNLGSVSVILDRRENDVSKTASTDLALPGDTLKYEITILPNVTNEDLVYELADQIPDGMTYVAGSATGGATVTKGKLSWSGTLPSPFLAEGSYEASDNISDASCDSPFGGGYVDLETEAGFMTDPGIAGDSVAYTAFTTGDPIEFYGRAHHGLSFTDDGFAIFDLVDNYGGSPWINQNIPDPELPNNLAAIFWQDFEIVHDTATNSGVTLATAANESLLVVEYDDIQQFGGGTSVMDMEIFIWRSVDDTPGAYEIVYAYDNVAASLPGTIGVENSDGSAATTADATAVADNLVVCLDWMGPAREPVVISYEATVDTDAVLGVAANRVASTTSNPGSRKATAKAPVRIMGTPIETIDAAVGRLSGLINDPPANLSDEDAAHLLAARRQLVRAMKPKRWVNETTLDPELGGRVFIHMRRAVVHLGGLSKGTAARAAANGVTKSLVNVSEILAQVAYGAAVEAGADQADLDRAAAKMAKAERKQARRQWKKAITANGGSWTASIQHLLG